MASFSRSAMLGSSAACTTRMEQLCIPKVQGHYRRWCAVSSPQQICWPQGNRASKRSLKDGLVSKQGTRRSAVVYASAVAADTYYLVVGLAHCFEKSEDKHLVDRLVIEPVSASSLECMATGARTSFKFATGVTLADAMKKDKSLLPLEFADGTFCDKWEVRCEAAARTWSRPHAQDNLMDVVPLGKVRGQFNFSLEDKRVLNFDNVVTDDDNIKQDISIDVYGRKQKEEQEEAADAATAAAAAKEQEADDLEALLSL